MRTLVQSVLVLQHWCLFAKMATAIYWQKWSKTISGKKEFTSFCQQSYIFSSCRSEITQGLFYRQVFLINQWKVASKNIFVGFNQFHFKAHVSVNVQKMFWLKFLIKIFILLWFFKMSLKIWRTSLLKLRLNAYYIKKSLQSASQTVLFFFVLLMTTTFFTWSSSTQRNIFRLELL